MKQKNVNERFLFKIYTFMVQWCDFNWILCWTKSWKATVDPNDRKKSWFEWKGLPILCNTIRFISILLI